MDMEKAMKDRVTDNKGGSEPLHFIEFMEICADSGIITEASARRICQFAKYQGGVGALPSSPEADANYEERFEYLLGFADDDTKSFDNYVVSGENFHAIELARTVALIPRIWRNLSPVLFYGHTGQGKTHLLSAMARASRQRSLILNTNDLMMEYKYCLEAKKDLELLNWITRHNFLLLDDIQFAQGNFGFQNFLCSVFNRLSSDRNAIVLCSNIEPEDNRDYHITFYSRITSGITIELKMLDYDARVELLRQKFSHTGFGPDDVIIEYIAGEITQNVRTLKAAARAVIACLLATPGRSEIDLPTVKKLLKSMHLYDVPGLKAEKTARPSPESVAVCPECAVEEPEADKAGEEDSAEVEPSPFIVVDIEDEKDKEAVETDDVAEILAEPEEEPELEQVNEPEKEQVKEERTTANHQGEYRNLVASASTVDKQIDALLQAAEQRIEQLRRKNAGPAEIAKLEKAVVHLKNKDLEAAMVALK